MSSINNGLALVKLGAVGSDGGLGTALENIGKIKEGSFKVNHTEGDKVEFKEEASDIPFYVRQKEGTLGFEFEVHDADGPAFVRVWGGTYDTTTKKYTPPKRIIPKEMSFQAIPEFGHGFDVPRALVSGRFSDAMGKDSLLGLIVTVTVLECQKEGVSNFDNPHYPLTTP